MDIGHWRRWQTVMLGLVIGVVMVASVAIEPTQAQGTKGGSSFEGFFQQQQQQQIPLSQQQVGSSFVQMFNSLSPIQQQQFINQMSSSNRKIIQQTIQPQTSQFISSQQFSSNNQLPVIGGSKSSTSSSSSSLSGGGGGNLISPGKQAALFKTQAQRLSTFGGQQPIGGLGSSKTSSSSFSSFNQASNELPQNDNINQFEEQFQSSRLVNLKPQPQQTKSRTLFNARVQEVKQIARPIVLPSSESSFRRVQSFSSQPIMFEQQREQLQFSQQPIVSTGTKSSKLLRQQQSFSSAPGQLLPSSDSFSSSSSSPSSSSSSSNLGSDSVEQQQDNSLADEQQVNVLEGAGISSSFNSQDFQQQQSQVDDPFAGGLTAASINNKWYIMKPVRDPKSMGLGDAKTLASSGKLRRVSIETALLMSTAKLGKGSASVTTTSAKPAASPPPPTSSTNSATTTAATTTKETTVPESSSTTTGSNIEKETRAKRLVEPAAGERLPKGGASQLDAEPDEESTIDEQENGE